MIHHPHCCISLSGLHKTLLHNWRISAWTAFVIISELSSSWFEPWTESKRVCYSTRVNSHRSSLEILLSTNILLLNIHHIAWQLCHKVPSILLLNGIATLGPIFRRLSFRNNFRTTSFNNSHLWTLMQIWFGMWIIWLRWSLVWLLRFGHVIFLFRKVEFVLMVWDDVI